MSTLNDRRSPVEVCRANGWGVGTRLAGDEGYGVTVIEITGFGSTSMLARSIEHAGKRTWRDESSWVLYCRDWHEATEPETAWCEATPPGHPNAKCNLPDGHEGRHETNSGWWTERTHPATAEATP